MLVFVHTHLSMVHEHSYVLGLQSIALPLLLSLVTWVMALPVVPWVPGLGTPMSKYTFIQAPSTLYTPTFLCLIKVIVSRFMITWQVEPSGFHGDPEMEHSEDTSNREMESHSLPHALVTKASPFTPTCVFLGTPFCPNERMIGRLDSLTRPCTVSELLCMWPLPVVLGDTGGGAASLHSELPVYTEEHF